MPTDNPASPRATHFALVGPLLIGGAVSAPRLLRLEGDGTNGPRGVMTKDARP